MGIIQNEVVWNQKHRGMIFAIIEKISLSSEFRYHSENFAMIVKIQGIAKFKFSLCTVTFAMIAKFRYLSENMCIEKISQGLRNFRNPCEIFTMHSENHVCLLLPPVSSSASISSFPL